MISIIMGVFNAENSINDAINSILNQTYTSFEFIICDDGSTDKTLEIILKHKELNSNIIVLQNEKNMGLAKTLNKCLKIAKGEYIARMDADDISFVTRLKTQLAFLEENTEIAFVCANANYFYKNKIYKTTNLPLSPTKYDLFKANIFIHPTLLIRKNCLNAIKGYNENNNALRCEDYDLYFRLFAKGFLGVNLTDVLLNYYENPFDFSKHTLRTRINEFKIRLKGYKMLNAPLKYRFYALKPIILAFLPKKLYIKLKNKGLKYDYFK